MLYLVSQRTWEQLSHSREHYYLIEQLLKEEGIEVGTRPLPGPPSPEPSTKKRPGPRELPGINFLQVKAHVESTRYKEPEPKTEPKPGATLEWGDYTALIEAIERADPKRKREKPTPPPKPKKVREPRSERRAKLYTWIFAGIVAVILLTAGVASWNESNPGIFIGVSCMVATWVVSVLAIFAE